MKQVALPPKATINAPARNPNEKAISEDWTAARVLQEIVLVTQWWRLGDTDRVDAFLEIDTKVNALLTSAGTTLVLTDKQHETLLAAMQLPDRTIGPASLNRYYMKTFAAVLHAEAVPGDPEGPAVA